MMDESPRVRRILRDWSEVANEARRPAVPPRRVVFRSSLPGGMLAGLGLIAVALIAAVVLLGRNGPTGVGDSPSPSLNATPGASVTPSPSASAIPSPTPSPSASPSPTPTIPPAVGRCEPANLVARITRWEGAAGHRIANVELTNAGSNPCTVSTMAKPQLVDGKGSDLIDGATPPASGSLTMAPGGVLKTLVQDGNYCGSAPVPPVSVAFVLSGGGRIVATPVSPGDTTVPPCNGPPGSAGTIEMQPWAP